MKRYSIFTFLALLFTTFLMQSCLKDQEDTFDKLSSLRQQEYMEKAQNTLVNAPYGWVFDIYPDPSLEYGGYAFTVKFDKQEAEVRSILNTSLVEKSYYKMTSEEGPAITFDTYNTLMHLFSNPSSSQYQAMKGDFEFVVDSITDDLIRVHGYRSKNVMYLRKLTKPAKDYINDVESFSDAFGKSGYLDFKGQISGTDVQGKIAPGDMSVTLKMGDKTEEMPFVYTDQGIRLYQPIVIGDFALSDLNLNSANDTFTANDFHGKTATLTAIQPDWIKKFKAYEGTYDLTMTLRVKNAAGKLVNTNVTTEVKLSTNSDMASYSMSGLNSNYDVKLTYDKNTNQLQLLYQILCTAPNGHTVRMLPWDTEKGYITWSPKVGMSLEWDANTNTFSFTDNGVWKTSGNEVGGFILYDYNSGGGRIGSADSDALLPYCILGKSAFISKLTSLKKK